MKASQCSDAQGAEGVRVADSCRKAGVSPATDFNRKKKKVEGMTPQEMRRLKQLEDENTKLQKADSRPQPRPRDIAGRHRAKCWSARSVQGFWTRDEHTLLEVSGLSRVSCGCSEAMGVSRAVLG